MMHRLRRYDVFCFAQNDVAPVGRNDAMFAQCAVRHTSFAQRTSLGEAVIICRRQTSFAEGKHHSKNAPLSVDKSAFLLAHPYKIDPYKAIVQKQSAIFAAKVHLSLGDDGRCTRPLSSGVQRHACKRSYVFDFKKASKRLRFAFSTPCCEKQLLQWFYHLH